MAQESKRYNSMEKVLQQINKQIIALPESEVKKNNAILLEILEKIISKMKGIDAPFANVFRKLFFGGSFYDGLKVAHPDEYDIHMLLIIPPTAETKIIVSNVPGFVHVKFLNNFVANLEGAYEGFKQFISKNNFIEASKVRQWMEKTFQKALNTFPKTGNKYQIQTQYGKCLINIRKTGPAFTLRVEMDRSHMDVDLVPCFIFGNDQWPKEQFRGNPCPKEKANFYIVPKQPKSMQGYNDHYWLLNFQEQEREVTKGMATLKPTIKLLKKMRDNLKHDVIASYYLKSVAIWVLEEKKNDPNFFKSSSLSYVFMTVLKKYQDFLEKKNIPYYWNKNYNLVKNIRPVTIDNIKNKIAKVIADVEKNLDKDPWAIAKYIVSPEEEARIRMNSLSI